MLMSWSRAPGASTFSWMAGDMPESVSPPALPSQALLFVCVCGIMSSVKATPNVDEVVGGNVRRLRGTKRQDELAADLRQLGSEWTQPTVAAVESGSRRVRISELPFLCAILGCSVRDLLAGPGYVELAPDARRLRGEGVSIELAALQDAVMGLPAELVDQVSSVLAEAEASARESALIRRAWRELAPDYLDDQWEISRSVDNDAERAAARRLDQDEVTVAIAAFGLWGRSLTAERDAQAADQAPVGADERSLQAIRGRVTRRLVDQLGARIREVDAAMANVDAAAARAAAPRETEAPDPKRRS